MIGVAVKLPFRICAVQGALYSWNKQAVFVLEQYLTACITAQSAPFLGVAMCCEILLLAYFKSHLAVTASHPNMPQATIKNPRSFSQISVMSSIGAQIGIFDLAKGQPAMSLQRQASWPLRPSKFHGTGLPVRALVCYYIQRNIQVP